MLFVAIPCVTYLVIGILDLSGSRIYHSNEKLAIAFKITQGLHALFSTLQSYILGDFHVQTKKLQNANLAFSYSIALFRPIVDLNFRSEGSVSKHKATKFNFYSFMLYETYACLS